jgi:HAD superfamily hydrolase (TIGR01509 family)
MKNPRERKNWLFDLDGTLVNSEPVHEAAYRAALSELAPHALAAFDYGNCRGLNTETVIEGLPIPSAELRRRLVELKRDRFARLIRSGAPIAQPGAHPLLTRLRASGHACYLVTGAATRSADLMLDEASLRDFFVGIITGDPQLPGKPDPALYRACLSQFRLDPGDCVAIEDSEAGARAAHACAIPVITVGKQPVTIAARSFPSLLALYQSLRWD